MTAKRERRTTEWVVLEQIEAPIGDGSSGPAWVVVASHVSNSKAEALDAVVGDKTGVFKAVAKAAWAGGRVKAQETLVTSKPITD